MLEENKKQLQLTEHRAKIAAINDAKKKWVKANRIKWAKRIVVFLIFLITLIYPKQIGSVIGIWINQFFGTIIKESVK